MSATLSPSQIGNYQRYTHEKPCKTLNFKQVMCQGTCKTRRSIGQFTHHPAICDRCYNRMPKTA